MIVKKFFKKHHVSPFIYDYCDFVGQNLKYFYLSVRISGVLIVGGYGNSSTVVLSSVEFISPATGNMKLARLKTAKGSLAKHDGTIVSCGGVKNFSTYPTFDHGKWKRNSVFTEERVYASAVSTDSATFIFGGRKNPNTFDYCRKESLPIF